MRSVWGGARKNRSNESVKAGDSNNVMKCVITESIERDTFVGPDG